MRSNAGGLHFGLSDVKDAFHRLRQPLWLARYSCMRPLEAHYLGLTGRELEGRVLRARDKVYPVPGSLCMGFTWPLVLLPGHQRESGWVFDLRGSMHDDSKGEVRHYVYVDNLGVVSPREAVVRDALEEFDNEFSS